MEEHSELFFRKSYRTNTLKLTQCGRVHETWNVVLSDFDRERKLKSQDLLEELFATIIPKIMSFQPISDLSSAIDRKSFLGSLLSTLIAGLLPPCF